MGRGEETNFWLAKSITTSFELEKTPDLFHYYHHSQKSKVKHTFAQQNCNLLGNLLMLAWKTYHKACEHRLFGSSGGLPVDGTGHVGHFHLDHHLEETQNSCSSNECRPSSQTPPPEHRLACNIDVTSAVGWGMSFGAKNGRKHFSGPLFTPQTLVLRPYQKQFLQTHCKPNLIQYISLQKTVFSEKMNCIHIYFSNPMETN